MKCFQRAPQNRTQNVAELAGDILDAVQAPFANQVRAKIAATLEPRSGRDPLATSGGMTMNTGSYGAILSQSGSSRIIVRRARIDLAGRRGRRRRWRLPKRRWGLWLVPAAVIVLGGAAFLAFGGKGEEATATKPTTSAAATAPTELPTTTATASTAPSATAPAPPTATATVTATATATQQQAPPRIVHAPWRGQVPRINPTVSPPSTTAAPPPHPTTPPVATAPPANTAKPDPLGDRQ